MLFIDDFCLQRCCIFASLMRVLLKRADKIVYIHHFVIALKKIKKFNIFLNMVVEEQSEDGQSIACISTALEVDVSGMYPLLLILAVKNDFSRLIKEG